TIPMVVVPIKVTVDSVAGSPVFDPTVGNPCDNDVSAITRFVNSPLVNNVSHLTIIGVDVGTTQYVDGFRRAEFFSTIGGSAAYSNTFSPVAVAPLTSLQSLTTGSHGTTA